MPGFRCFHDGRNHHRWYRLHRSHQRNRRTIHQPDLWFTWCDDFSAARNYAFSLATMDYIYCPDADEYLDLENQRRFLRLKGALLPEIEIVQMNYITPPDFNTVQNCKKSHVQNFLNACARFHGSIRFTKRSALIPSSMTVILIFCTTHIPCMPSGILPCLKKHFVKIMSSRRKSRACMQENFINVGMRKIFYARRIIFVTLWSTRWCRIRVYSGTRCPYPKFCGWFLFDLSERYVQFFLLRNLLWDRTILPGTAESPGSFSVVLQCCIWDTACSGYWNFREKALLQLAECYRTLAENELCDPCSAGDLLSRASEYEQQAQAWELPEEL